MTCCSELELMRYADAETGLDETAATELHLTTCPLCRARLAHLRAEARALVDALTSDALPVDIPAFTAPASRRAIVAGAALTLLTAALVAAARAQLDLTVPAPLRWLNPLDVGGSFDLAIRLALFLTRYGGAIMESITQTAAAVALVGVAAWLAFGLRKRGPAQSMLVCLACGLTALPAPSHALEIRHNEAGQILVPADETIADTLIAAGETVEINGNVEGDLIAFGRRVVIRGRVGGQLITGASVVSIEGAVEDSVIAMGQTVDVSPSRIGGNLYGFGTTVTTGAQTSIAQNAIVVAQRANFAGPVAHDVFAAGENIEVSNAIGGSLTGYAQGITLLAPARIAGDFTAHVPAADSVTVSPGAVVGGEFTTDLHEHHGEASRYATPGYYMLQLLRFAAAFVTGLVILSLVPQLRRLSLERATDVFTASGIGLLTLVATPIIAVLVAITVIGMPVAAFGILLWIVGLYLAKVVLAHFIGARLMERSGDTRHFSVPLGAGLALVILVINLPLIGGLLNFLLTVCGLGMLLLYLWRALQESMAKA